MLCPPFSKRANQIEAAASYFGWSVQLDQKNVVASLLEKANKYRELARWVTDSETVQRILSLAEELKQRARAMAKPSEDQIRKRAQELWERAGKPDGRDEEFWHQAEKELQGADEESPSLRTPDNL
jgi:cell fate (sporulation/competence/biofilm development) regulator YlbF (YheA/YmcA/DUF963 family)